MQDGSNVRRQPNLPPNPIIDHLYSLCKQLNQAAINRDEQRLQPLWDALETYFVLAQKSGEKLPLPDEHIMPSNEVELEYDNRLKFAEFESISIAIMKHIEKKWTITRLEMA